MSTAVRLQDREETAAGKIRCKKVTSSCDPHVVIKGRLMSLSKRKGRGEKRGQGRQELFASVFVSHTKNAAACLDPGKECRHTGLAS